MHPVKIHIPQPCHENWSNMTPEAQGRFCLACQKTVYDFTQLSDRTIAEKISSGENLCGRFSPTQLDRELVVHRKKSTIWTAGIAGILGIFNSGNDPLYAQEQTQTIQTDSLASFVRKKQAVAARANS
ncbi:hypothetical protein [Flavobacterium sp.]|uniref:hypothetical protein n=1 Tax=Flavobacterium sp. TaxID=239 RepID=UPI0039E3B168